jgi:hypothetical protein
MVDQLADLFHTTHKVKTQQLDLRIAHDRVGSSADPTLNGHLKYPNNLDQSLNDATTEKIREYRVRLLFLQTHRETLPVPRPTQCVRGV